MNQHFESTFLEPDQINRSIKTVDIFDLAGCLFGPKSWRDYERQRMNFEMDMWVQSVIISVGLVVLAVFVYFVLLTFAPQLHLPNPAQLLRLLNHN